MALSRDVKTNIAVVAGMVLFAGFVVGYSMYDDAQKALKARQLEQRGIQLAAQRRAVAEAAWKAEKPAILAEIEQHITALRVNDAESLMQKYRDVAGDEFDRFKRPLAIAKARADLAAIPASQVIAREGALGGLMRLEPENPQWAKEYSIAKKAGDRERAKELADQARREQEAKAARRRQGVHIGMTESDVLQSSWGRPRHVNRTTTARGTREQWVYGGGYLYFENGILTTIQN